MTSKIYTSRKNNVTEASKAATITDDGPLIPVSESIRTGIWTNYFSYFFYKTPKRHVRIVLDI